MDVVLMKHQILRKCMRKIVWQLIKRIDICFLGLKE